MSDQNHDQNHDQPSDPLLRHTPADPEPVEPARVPQRITIHTSPIPLPTSQPDGTPPPSPQWQQSQPYGASPHARYAPVATPRGAGLRRLLLPLLVVLLIAGVAAVLFRDRLFGEEADTPAFPEEWDPRAADIAEFVSATRQLQWDHPVYVDFLPEAEFVALFDQPVEPPSDDELARAQQESDLYDALGLAVGYDVAAGQATVGAVTTLGFYSLDRDRVLVRGDVLTPAVQLVLAHELTHALQQQHFELEMGGPDDLALRAVLEADALRVENAFRATLSPADQATADDGLTLPTDAEAGLSDVPWAVLDQTYAPYALGPVLVQRAFTQAGNAGVDQLILDPPSEEVLLNPWLLGTEQSERELTVSAPTGSVVIDEPRQLSPFDLLLMLDAWLPWSQARGALDGWAGGEYTSYVRSGTVCLTAVVGFDQTATPFADALEDWATAAGSDAVPVTIVNDVTFEACSRGNAAEAPPTPVVTPLDSLLVERDVVAFAGSNASIERIADYQCVAAALIDDPLVAPLLLLDTLDDGQQALFAWQSTIAANECGVPPISAAP